MHRVTLRWGNVHMPQLRWFHSEARRRLPLILILVCFWACARREDPQAALDHATRTFQHGDLVAATKEAKIGYAKFRHLGADWGWRFLILEANALTRQGLKDEALSALASKPGP